MQSAPAAAARCGRSPQRAPPARSARVSAPAGAGVASFARRAAPACVRPPATPRAERKVVVRAESGSASPAEEEGKDGFEILLPYAYGAMAVAFAAYFAVGVAAPEKLMSDVCFAGLSNTAFQGTGALEAALTRLAACAAAAPAAACWSLRSAAMHDRLKSTTYQRLNIGIALFALFQGFADTLLRYLELQAPCKASIIVGGVLPFVIASLGLWKGGISGEKLALVEDLVVAEDYKALADRPVATPRAAAHTIGYCVFMFTGVVLGLAPQEVLQWLGVDAPSSAACHIVRCVGALSFVTGKGHAVLKDGWNRGRLGASTFKQMDLGIGVAGVGQAAALGAAAASGVAAVSAATCIMCATWGVTGAFALYGFLTDKK
ncbi:unnamed protein product [Pedinophyceae sp. YPF-701]|nr:unnamed protein product [Pedinophyceae sp. YPF-701]